MAKILLPEQSIKYVYDDYTENLLTQYAQQLEQQEKLFAGRNKHLNQYQYARLRDQDPVMMAILDVIAKIYEQAIPIAIIINGGEDTTDTGPTDSDTKH